MSEPSKLTPPIVPPTRARQTARPWYRQWRGLLLISLAVSLSAGIVLAASSGGLGGTERATPGALKSDPYGTSPLMMEAEAVLRASRLSPQEVTALGELAAEHVLAFSRHTALDDRPRHSLLSIKLTPGSDVQSIRRRWGLTTQQFAEINPDVDLSALEPGDGVAVWRYDDESPGRSRSRPNAGRLVTGELMPTGEGWVVREPRLAFGAEQTIDGLIGALRVVAAEFPGGQPMMIADISKRAGGRFSPHRSHQSGRDVDATYYRNTLEAPTFRRTRPQNLDAARTWAFIRTLIIEHDVVYIFISRDLMVRLFEHAESIGEHPAFLSEVFAYGPRRHRNHRGIIRFEPGHHDHMHIRFPCTSQDIRCRATR